jgi:Kdo2-lipid IVA lauroyltransferase/acyltransferase
LRQLLLRFGEWLGGLAWVLGIRRAVALDGLRRAFPALSVRERKKIGRASYVQLGRSIAEILLPMRDEELARAVRFDRWELLNPGPGPEGVVAAVAHFGNFELEARAAARRGLKLTIIARNLRDVFGRWLVADRARTGVGQIGDRGSTGAALAVLRRGEVLGVAIDQNMRASRGIFVDFFGDKACTTPAAAILALRTGARLVAVFPVRQPDGTYVVKVRGPFTTRLSGHAAIVDLTEQLTRAVEEEIRLHPDHWFWVHRRWKTRPEVAPAGEV